MGPSRRILDYKTEILDLVETFLAAQTKAEEIERGIAGEELKKCEAEEWSADIGNDYFKMELDYEENFEVIFFLIFFPFFWKLFE